MNEPKEIEIVISKGRVRVIYDDDIADLIEEGDSSITRASHVEPAGHGWYADMSPSGGPVLVGFRNRKQALSAEVAWLKDNRDL